MRSAPTQKMYGLPVTAMNAGSAARAAVIASSRLVSPAGPKVFGLVWSKPLSRVIRAAGRSSPGTLTWRSSALVTTSFGAASALTVPPSFATAGLASSLLALTCHPPSVGFSQMTVPPMPMPMHMAVRP